ncbi:MAG: hypothetical protein ABEJ72_08130, partial [Candidatus Aenigmatarchaeota archaeon]
ERIYQDFTVQESDDGQYIEVVFDASGGAPDSETFSIFQEKLRKLQTIYQEKEDRVGRNKDREYANNFDEVVGNIYKTVAEVADELARQQDKPTRVVGRWEEHVREGGDD